MSILLKVLLFALLSLGFSLAEDMPEGSEQFYVSSNLFITLSILPAECNMPDESVNLACGYYRGDFPTFRANLDAVVTQYLPGLVLAADWFENGEGLVRDYRSENGQYLIGYNPGGVIVVAFLPTR